MPAPPPPPPQLYTFMYNLAMATIAISEFRRQCLRLLEHLPAEGLTVTKRGRVVAEIQRPKRSPVDMIGCCPDIRIDPNDDLFSTGMRWDAESRHTRPARRRR